MSADGSITVAPVETPGDADREAILSILRQFNDSVAPPAESRDVVLLARDEAGEVVGGLSGRIGYRWLFVQYLGLSPVTRGRGTGTELMRQAEQIACDAGCIGIWLDTFSFQARGFYEKLGYSLLGEIPDYPPGESRFFLHKRIA